jgi:asparagine synthase (glutamine-hydrolysing)
MCGIFAFVCKKGKVLTPEEQQACVQHSVANSVRGPDTLTINKCDDYVFVFYRLAIHDLSHKGDQPFHGFDTEGHHEVHLMCNGEIYNWKELIQEYNLQLYSSSDCEVLYHLFFIFNYDFERLVRALDGEFSIVLQHQNYQTQTKTLYAARDPFGVRPLYKVESPHGFGFSSLMDGIQSFGKVSHLAPGTIWSYDGKQVQETPYFHYDVPFVLLSELTEEQMLDYYRNITDHLISAVKKRLDSDRKIAFLLSGGLDSSLVVGIAKKILGVQNVATFSIGFDQSPDVIHAQKVAKYLGTKHTVVPYTPEMGLAHLSQVAKVLETYDITTIRASVGQFLLAKYISEKTAYKVVLNGDGADECEMGYMYFHYSPSPAEGHDESIRLLKEIHCFDALRVDRCIGHFGLEARVPFLDPTFVSYYTSIPAVLRVPTKDRMEKQLIRDAFATLYPDVLPKEILYRRKEAFSDGVSNVQESWYERIQKWAQSTYGMEEKEIYKHWFNRSYPNQEQILPHYWMPQWTDATDPSARTLSVYAETF